MNGLQQAYSDRIDFVLLDIDRPDVQPVFEQFAIRSRSTYVLIDADGNELARWAGPLNEQTVAAELDEILAVVE